MSTNNPFTELRGDVRQLEHDISNIVQEKVRVFTEKYPDLGIDGLNVNILPIEMISKSDLRYVVVSKLDIKLLPEQYPL